MSISKYAGRSYPGGRRRANAGQRINIHDALAAYTINGARLMGHDNKLGSIEVGKTADLIVLNQNVVELADQGQADRIGETQVDMTIFDGNIVFEREQTDVFRR